MRSLFVTGGSGFIGKRFVRTLARDRWERVYCLSEPGQKMEPDVLERENLQYVAADLLDADRYRPILAQCDTVVHLAAITGKAAPAAYFRVNLDGTRALLDASCRAGVARFLFVSSIAARFADTSNYYYAESKRRAEEVVRASGLSFTIVRPTIVVGQGGGPWESLSRLAALPLLPLFGNGTRIQPIYVDDFVACLCTLLDARQFRNETIELGGPEVTTFESLLRQASHMRRGRKPWTVNVPVRPLVLVLRILERFAGPLLPLSTGQLAAFQNDGTVRLAPSAETGLPPMKSVHEMLRLVIENG